MCSSDLNTASDHASSFVSNSSSFACTSLRPPLSFRSSARMLKKANLIGSVPKFLRCKVHAVKINEENEPARATRYGSTPLLSSHRRKKGSSLRDSHPLRLFTPPARVAARRRRPHSSFFGPGSGPPFCIESRSSTSCNARLRAVCKSLPLPLLLAPPCPSPGSSPPDGPAVELLEEPDTPLARSEPAPGVFGGPGGLSQRTGGASHCGNGAGIGWIGPALA